MSRRAGVAVAAVLALLGSLVVPVVLAPTAAADIGDVKPFPLTTDAAGLTLTSTGDVWVSPALGKTLGQIAPDGDAVFYRVPILGQPVSGGDIVEDGAGKLWFAESTTNSLVSYALTGGTSTQLFVGSGIGKPKSLALGPDGNLWYTAGTNGTGIGRTSPAGSGNTFSTPFGVNDIAAGPGNWLAFGISSRSAVGRITTAGAISTTAMPAPTGSVAVAADGTIWAGGVNNGNLYRLTPDGTISTFQLGTNVSGIAFAPDGSAWFSADNKVGQVTTGGQISKFNFAGATRGIALGSDGNMWVLGSSVIARVLTGIAPASTKAPELSAAANTSGATVTATRGGWKYLPSSYDFQWQRCTANDASSCTDIGGATKGSYTITDADLGGWLRIAVRATNLNGPSKPAPSALFQAAPKATAPTQPTNPTPNAPSPVTGVGKATIASGVTATLSGPSSVKRKTAHAFAVTFNSPLPRGAVKFSLINAAGAEAYVLSGGKPVTKKGKKASRAIIAARVPKSVPKGAYTLVAVYTSTTTQTATYPVTTLTRPLTVR